MQNQLIAFRSDFREALLDFLWRQWSSLGIAGEGAAAENRIIDPEALICVTCTLGRHEPRLFDEAADWLRENGSLIHLSRLKAIYSLPELECKRTLGSLALHLEKYAGTQKWKALILDPVHDESANPFFMSAGMITGNMKLDPHFKAQGLARGEFRFSGKSGRAQGNGGSNLLIRLRSLFGVNARADILAYLLSKEEGHPHAIARQTHYFVKTIQDALVQMRDSGLIHARNETGKKIYGLDRAAWKPLLFPDSDPPHFMDWPTIFAQYLALDGILAELGMRDASDVFIAARLKTWARDAIPRLASAGFPQLMHDEAGFPGEAYLPVFFEAMGKAITLLKQKPVMASPAGRSANPAPPRSPPDRPSLPAPPAR